MDFRTKRLLVRRLFVLHAVLSLFLLLIIARLTDLQIVRGGQFRETARAQHFGGVVLPARRGEILGLNSKTDETAILATNTTLDLVYVDPLVVDDPVLVADTLAQVLVTEEVHRFCQEGAPQCPRELIPFFAEMYDPLAFVRRLQSGALLERLPTTLVGYRSSNIVLMDLSELRRRFARDIENRISEKHVTFVPLKYSATKVEMEEISRMSAPGIDVGFDRYLVSADPERVPQSRISDISRQLASILKLDPLLIEQSLRSRPLRYVPIMRRLSPALSLKIKALKVRSFKDVSRQRSNARSREEVEKLKDPLRGIALLPEHWRYYPDGTIASQVVGFLNANQEPQYGIERTFNSQLRGQEGLISTVSDPMGGQILTAEQRIVDPQDGDTVILTIDPSIQKEVERILEEGIERYQANSAQAIVMDPFTGKILAMANAPLFNRNGYGGVYEKVPLFISFLPS